MHAQPMQVDGWLAHPAQVAAHDDAQVGMQLCAVLCGMLQHNHGYFIPYCIITYLYQLPRL